MEITMTPFQQEQMIIANQHLERIAKAIERLELMLENPHEPCGQWELIRDKIEELKRT